MKRCFLLLVSGLICVSLSLAHNLERYPEVHQWQVLLDRMDVFEKVHARYREQIELMETRMKVAESKILEMESLKIKLKAQDKMIARLNLLELNRAEHKHVCPVKDLQCELFLKSSNAIPYQSSNIHRSRSNKSKFIAEATHSVKNRRDVKGQVHVERRIDRTSRVAFSTYLSHALQELGREHVIVFDQVEYNEGNGYDKLLGIFICPVSGTYFFAASMLGFPNEQVHTEIVLDGSKTAGMDSDSRGGAEFPQGTNIAIFRCALGQRVWVRIIEHLGTNLHGDQDRFTKFAGFMLWSDE